MTTLAAANPPPAIARKLAALRRSVYLGLGLRGLSVWVLYLAAFVPLSLALDFHGRLDRLQRALVLVLAVAVWAVAAYRRLVRPFLRRIDDDQLSLRVEKAFPQLGQGLVTAVELSRPCDWQALGVSPVMVAAAVQQGARAAAALDFRRALDPRFVARARLSALAALAALAGLGAAFSAPPTADTLRLWLARNVLLADVDWPQRTHLLLLEAAQGAVTLPRGDDWELNVEVQGAVPGTLSVEVRPEPGGGPAYTEELAQTGERRFRAGFRNLLAPFRLRVRGGDALTPWVRVRLVDRPSAQAVRLAALLPPYADPSQTPRDLPSGQSSHEVLRGSRLSVWLEPSQPLARAELQLADKPLADLVPAPTPASQPAPGGSAPAWTVTLAPDQLVSGTYSLHLTDTQGLVSRRPARFTLKVVPDRKPAVRARLAGVSPAMVTARALIPIQCRISDDFLITQAALAWRAAEAEAPGVRETVLPLADLAAQLPAREVSHTCRFDLEPLELTPGAILSFHVQATDNDVVSGPNAGQSATFSPRIATDQEMRAELLRREQEHRQQFERLLKDQEDLQADARSVQVVVRGKPAWTPDQKQQAARLEKRQRLAIERAQASAEQFNAILAEFVNNRLEQDDGRLARRIRESIVGPLGALTSEPMPRAADLLDAARKAEGPARDQALEQAVARQTEIILAMRQILRFMEKWEGYQEAINLMHEILKAQDDVTRATIKELERRIGEAFRDP